MDSRKWFDINNKYLINEKTNDKIYKIVDNKFEKKTALKKTG